MQTRLAADIKELTLTLMKKIRCPKCDRFVTFDETQYTAGQTLVLSCEWCGKEFKIKLKSKEAPSPGTPVVPLPTADNSAAPMLADDETPDITTLPHLTVVENTFAYRQELPLAEGDNLIGRRNKGTDVDIAIDTNDPSMDRRHCYIHVRRKPTGEYVCTLRDNQSICGTFHMNELLGPHDRLRLDDGAIITLGATTLIFHLPTDQAAE